MQVVYKIVRFLFLGNSRASPDPMNPAEKGLGFRIRITGFIMTRVEIVYLEFYIKLLNQKIQVYKYKSTLVYSMAVLGQKIKTQLNSNSYSLIILQVLKIARFLVVQKVLQLDPQPIRIIKIQAEQAKQGSWAGDTADYDLGIIIKNKGFAENTARNLILLSLLLSIYSQDTAFISYISCHGCMPFQTRVDIIVGKFIVQD